MLSASTDNVNQLRTIIDRVSTSIAPKRLNKIVDIYNATLNNVTYALQICKSSSSSDSQQIICTICNVVTNSTDAPVCFDTVVKKPKNVKLTSSFNLDRLVSVTITNQDLLNAVINRSRNLDFDSDLYSSYRIQLIQIVILICLIPYNIKIID